MKRIVFAVTLFALAGVARAQTPDRGVTLGARLAYGVPYGHAERALALGDYAARSVPVVVEAGWRFNRQLAVGAYFQYAYASAGSSICAAIPPAARSSGSSCSSASGRDLRYGIEGTYRFALPAMTPWVGLGIGGESTELTSTIHIPAVPSVSQAFNGDVTVKRSTAVVGEVNLQGGVEWAVSPRASIGPFVTVTFSRYANASYSPDPWGLAGAIPSGDERWHEWLLLGVKGTFDL